MAAVICTTLALACVVCILVIFGRVCDRFGGYDGKE